MIVARGEIEIIAYYSYGNHNNYMLIDRQLLIMNEKLWKLQAKINQTMKTKRNRLLRWFLVRQRPSSL
jgi:hypothetical protein